jgi:hypothetical protein
MKLTYAMQEMNNPAWKGMDDQIATVMSCARSYGYSRTDIRENLSTATPPGGPQLALWSFRRECKLFTCTCMKLILLVCPYER